MVLLLQHGAAPDAATHDLYTPLHIAAKEGHDEVVRVLLEHGANQTLMTNVRTRPYSLIGSLRSTAAENAVSPMVEIAAERSSWALRKVTPEHSGPHNATFLWEHTF